MTQGSLFFEGQGKVQETLVRITRKLEELQIPYAVVGGMALFAHGFRRYTEDVDILVTPEGLKRVHDELEGRGYVPPFAKSKHLRDTDTRVKIEFLTTGGYPGDGKPKPVAFPDPSNAAIAVDGIQYIDLPTLVELKLASGMSSAHRGKDLTDVEEIIQALHLPADFGQNLNDYVRGKYQELWNKLRFNTKRYILVCPDSALPENPKSLREILEHSEALTNRLKAMLADGLTFDESHGTADGCFYLYTYDRILADKYHMMPEDDLFDESSLHGGNQ
ncbi:MAG TPA: hypothetical protein VHZ24_13820 [Pirellulales bacterium]|jgi:hypothetical protein|nr:hypothetical protein [Pirellulales bacterium]